MRRAVATDIVAILRPVQREMLQFVGFDVLAPQIAYGRYDWNKASEPSFLPPYAERLKLIEGEAPFEVGIY
jgi:NAD(P)H dehydrogenase (quinone)